MELIAAIGLLVLLALAAPRWGHDSRHLGSCDGWFGTPRPRGPRSSRPGAALHGTWVALAGARAQIARSAFQSGAAPRHLRGLVIRAARFGPTRAPVRRTDRSGGPVALAQ